MRHGATSGAARAVTAAVQRIDSAFLRIAYSLEGELSQLRIPEPRRPGVGTNLWRHTCFELFIAQRGVPGYHEFNFSPSGEWAVYAFSGYRRSAALAEPFGQPRIKVRKEDHRLELEALIRLEPTLPADQPLVAGLTAVVEDAQGVLSYWALSHPAENPDFHRAEAFMLEIDAVRN